MIETALTITAFVAAMMLLIEYVNVLTAGAWPRRLAGLPGGPYLAAAVLGLIPGCLGSFAAVSMFNHGLLTLGALVTCMIATSGDEAFVLLALAPRQAPALMAALFGCGVACGWLVDAVTGKRRTRSSADCLALHPEAGETCFERRRLLAQWRECTPARGMLAGGLLLFLGALAAGRVAADEEAWVRATLLVVSGLALLVAVTAPDHFLEEHLWNHVVRKHVPRLFAWTLGALAVVRWLPNWLPRGGLAGRQPWVLLLAACLVGLIPESGPHVIFVTLYAKGAIPFSVLLASSIVQDGHGMLPLLAHSRREFITVKAINLAAGLAAGAAALAAGF